MMKYFIFSGLLVFLTACGAKQNESSQQQIGIGQAQAVKRLDPYSSPLYAAQKMVQAMDFEVTLLNGETFRLSEQKGKVVLINIWATWCPPCREEMPDLVDLYNTYKNQGYMALGVSIDKQGRSVVVPFVKKYSVTYPITIDDGPFMEKYGPIMGIPTTYIIGREGNLRYFAVGALTKKELEPRIKKLLDEEK